MVLEEMLDEWARHADLASFRALVAEVENYDRKHRGDLVRTLRVFFAANANTSEAADRLYLHRNSLPYRLARVSQLTGLDLKDHRARLVLQLGLLAASVEKEREDEAQHP